MEPTGWLDHQKAIASSREYVRYVREAAHYTIRREAKIFHFDGEDAFCEVPK